MVELFSGSQSTSVHETETELLVEGKLQGVVEGGEKQVCDVGHSTYIV